MSDDTNDTTQTDVSSIKAELETVLSGDNPLENLRIVQTGPVHYTVLSARNGSATIQRVNLQNGECSCSDMTYNKNISTSSEGGREICAHLAVAMLEHPQLEPEQSAAYQHMGLLDSAERVMAKLENEHSDIKQLVETATDAKATAESAAGTGDTAENGTDGDAAPDTDGDAEAAAEKLQAAFDDVIDDMEVEAVAGHVWFKTGYNTPDDWPFPGGDDTFSVLTSPEMTKYVHDGSPEWADSPHPLDDSRPGEYWKNALEPSDVDEYIAEVLQ